MKLTTLKYSRLLAVGLTGALFTLGASAEKPEWAGGGKNGKQGQKEMQVPPDAPGQSGKPGKGAKGHEAEASANVTVGGYFGDSQRTVIRDYYGEQSRVGNCPPGLAKKNNGCMPPGQARKWAVGQALPRDVVYYSVPQSIVIQLGAPPPEHRYVRVAADILLIAIGTNLVIDAIQDLGRI
ncbi:MAG: hypothetical protein H7228_16035 [Polaromonas sp.]|nr:hypothetical protein [Polaromonas sp.]